MNTITKIILSTCVIFNLSYATENNSVPEKSLDSTSSKINAMTTSRFKLLLGTCILASSGILSNSILRWNGMGLGASTVIHALADEIPGKYQFLKRNIQEGALFPIFLNLYVIASHLPATIGDAIIADSPSLRYIHKKSFSATEAIRLSIERLLGCAIFVLLYSEIKDYFSPEKITNQQSL